MKYRYSSRFNLLAGDYSKMFDESSARRATRRPRGTDVASMEELIEPRLLKRLKVGELRDLLAERGLSTDGNKDALVARLDRPLKPDRAKWSAPQETPEPTEVLDWTSRGHIGEVDKEREKERVFKRRAAKKAGVTM